MLAARFVMTIKTALPVVRFLMLNLVLGGVSPGQIKPGINATFGAPVTTAFKEANPTSQLKLGDLTGHGEYVRNLQAHEGGRNFEHIRRAANRAGPEVQILKSGLS